MKNVKSSEIGDLDTIAMEPHRPKLNHVRLLFYNTGTGSEVRSWVPPGLPWLVHMPTLIVSFMDIHAPVSLCLIYIHLEPAV